MDSSEFESSHSPESFSTHKHSALKQQRHMLIRQTAVKLCLQNIAGGAQIKMRTSLMRHAQQRPIIAPVALARTVELVRNMSSSARTSPASPAPPIDLHCPGVVSVSNLLDADECSALLRKAENEIGFEEASVRTGDGPLGQTMMKDVRNNDRCMFDDFNMSNDLFERLRQRGVFEYFVHSQLGVPVAVNERLRFYRYNPGQRFKKHRDGIERVRDFVSQVTMLVYLNNDCQGGETAILGRGGLRTIVEVKPTVGSALLFWHNTLHEGRQVTSGRKYVLRSDLFYSRPS